MPRKATTGPAVYERVTELAAQGKSRTEAFQQVAEERGMNAGTVAVNYYRTARSQGGTQPKRAQATSARSAASPSKRTSTRRSPAQTASNRPVAANGDLVALATQIGDLVEQLARQIVERDQRMRDILG